jgi:hypothetical protein
MSELNLRFNPYGVYIDQTNVSNVIIPKDLRIALSQATTYDVLLQNQVKFQGKSIYHTLYPGPAYFPTNFKDILMLLV